LALRRGLAARLDGLQLLQEIKRRGIGAVDDLLAEGPVHVITRNEPRYVVMDECRYQELVDAYHEAYVARVLAAKAAADFETTLAGRRKAAEAEFTEKMAESQARLEEAQQHAEQTRVDADAAHGDALREARRIVEEAQQQAEQIVVEAKATATRVRADSERELVAATQRRDSINAQLSNVRQMLATLTGTSVDLPDVEEEASAEPSDEPTDVADTADEPGVAGPVDETDEVSEDVSEEQSEEGSDDAEGSEDSEDSEDGSSDQADEADQVDEDEAELARSRGGH